MYLVPVSFLQLVQDISYISVDSDQLFFASLFHQPTDDFPAVAIDA